MRATHYRWNDLPREALNPQLGRRLIATERMMIAHVYLEQGCVIPRHEHENEQLTYILEGKLRFWLGDDESEAVDVAARNENALLDTSWQPEGVIRRAVRRLGDHRVLFASDWPFLGTHLRMQVDVVAAGLDRRPAALERVFQRNAEALLGLRAR